MFEFQVYNDTNDSVWSLIYPVFQVNPGGPIVTTTLLGSEESLTGVLVWEQTCNNTVPVPVSSGTYYIVGQIGPIFMNGLTIETTPIQIVIASSNSNSNTFPGLTVQAWNDASYSFGSRKWEFLYEPSFDSSFESSMNFPFPFFPMNPSEAEMYCGKPVLLTVCVTSGVTQMDGTVLNATAGTSCSLDGMEITVASANPSNAVLVLKTLL